MTTRSHDTPFRTRLFRVRAALITAALLLSSTASLASEPSRLPWQMEDFWDLGHAEVARYRGKVEIEGMTMEVPLEIVTRAAVIWRDTLTEADPSKGSEGTVEAIKTTLHRSIRTRSPRREQIVSYFAREDLEPQRLVVTMLDRRETVFATWSRNRGRLRFFAESWPTGEGEHPLSPTERMLFSDDLATRLRGLAVVKEGRWEATLVESLLDATAPAPRTTAAEITVGPIEELEVEAGEFSVRPVTVTRHGPEGVELSDVLYFDRRPPNRMVLWRLAGGDEYELVDVRRASADTIDGPGRLLPSSRAASVETSNEAEEEPDATREEEPDGALLKKHER